MKHIGFTGTRHGMTFEQKQLVANIIRGERGTHAHHGDCVGADAEFHAISDLIGLTIIGHIPVNESDRAFCTFHASMPALPYMRRNAEIVRCSDIMIATPFEMDEQERGRTWRTIAITRRARKPLVIVLPNGLCKYERWPCERVALATKEPDRG
jgi:hypothetical protein